jgi:DNA-binding transcriptional ArsR family regulator
MLNHHTNSAQLIVLFHALGDPTRWRMVERLSAGSASVSELARPHGLSLPAVMQHLRILEEARLVSTEKIGRVRLCQIRPEWIGMVDVWIKARQASMQRQFDQLEQFLEDEKGKPE